MACLYLTTSRAFHKSAYLLEAMAELSSFPYCWEGEQSDTAFCRRFKTSVWLKCPALLHCTKYNRVLHVYTPCAACMFACECMMTALHVVIVKLKPVRAVCIFSFCHEEQQTQTLTCRCLSDLLLGLEPMFDIVPLSAKRKAVQPVQAPHSAAASLHDGPAAAVP